MSKLIDLPSPNGEYSIEIYDSKHSISYSSGGDKGLGLDGHPEAKAGFGGKDAYDVFGTRLSHFEKVTWNGMSTAAKSKVAWDALKYIKNVTGYRVPLRPSRIYGGVSKALPKVGLGFVSTGLVVAKVISNKGFKASDILDGTITGISFISRGRWIVGVSFWELIF